MEFKPSKFTADSLQLHKASNTTFPIVRETNERIIRLWHKSVEEFVREMGIDETNAHRVELLQNDNNVKGNMSTETAIRFDGQIIGFVATEMKHTAAGLKFTITCQKVVQPA
jgi:hypothetical protein